MNDFSNSQSKNLPSVTEFHKNHYEIKTTEGIKPPWLLKLFGLRTILFTFVYFSLIAFGALGTYIYYIS